MAFSRWKTLEQPSYIYIYTYIYIYIYNCIHCTIHGSCGHFTVKRWLGKHKLPGEWRPGVGIGGLLLLGKNLAPLDTRAFFFLVESCGIISSIFHMYISRWWFQRFFNVHLLLGEDFHFSNIFKGVETTKQFHVIYIYFVNPFWSPLGYQLHGGNIGWRELRWLMTAHVFMFEHFYFSCFLEVPFFMFPVVWHGMKYQKIELPPLYLWGIWRNPAPHGM